MSEEMLNIKQTAELLKVGQSTIRRLVKDGKLPVVRVGGQLRFEAEQLELFITNNRVNQQKEVSK